MLGNRLIRKQLDPTIHMLAHVFKTSSMCSPADTEICTWHPTTSKMFYFTFFKCSLFWILCLSPKYRYIQLRVNKLDVVDILVTMLLQYCSRIWLHLSMISCRIPGYRSQMSGYQKGRPYKCRGPKHNYYKTLLYANLYFIRNQNDLVKSEEINFSLQILYIVLKDQNSR